LKISRTAIKTICLMLTFTAVLMLSGCTSYDNFRRTFIDKETEDSNVIYVGVFEADSIRTLVKRKSREFSWPTACTAM